MRNTIAQLTTLLFLTATQAQATLKGDAEAIDLADQMIESIGGKELWTKIRTLHIWERARTPNGDGVIGEFRRDLQEPRERYTLRNRRGTTIEFRWDKEGVWQTINGEPNQELPDDLHQTVQDYWHGEIYVMYHRLARQDENIRLELKDERSFIAFDENLDRRLGTFWVNKDGELYRWQHDDGTEYIYGPHKQFGDISFPDWGTQVDGSWSFYYLEVRWSGE